MNLIYRKKITSFPSSFTKKEMLHSRNNKTKKVNLSQTIRNVIRCHMHFNLFLIHFPTFLAHFLQKCSERNCPRKKSLQMLSSTTTCITTHYLYEQSGHYRPHYNLKKIFSLTHFLAPPHPLLLSFRFYQKHVSLLSLKLDFFSYGDDISCFKYV